MSHKQFVRHGARFFFLLLALTCTPMQALSFQAPTAPQQTPQPPRLPPTQFIHGHDYDTRHIKLDLRFDWQNERVLGTARITFAPLLTDLRRVESAAAHER